MATITPSIVKQLRDLTGAGMLDCKKALEASNGDLEQAGNEGRPEAAWEKIVEGRLANFYKESVLLEQAWVREPKTTIENLIKEHISKLQENITVRRFARFAIKE